MSVTVDYVNWPSASGGIIPGVSRADSGLKHISEVTDERSFDGKSSISLHQKTVSVDADTYLPHEI